MKKNSKKTEIISIRVTPTQKKLYQKQADMYQMPLTTYCADKLANGKERNIFARRVLNTRLVETGKAVDDIYDYMSRTDSEYVPKADLYPLLDNVKKGLNAVWKL